MSWSWNIGRLVGIPIRIHATFLLILLWIGWGRWMAERSAGAVAVGIIFVMAIFGCVVLHELGHALMARKYGIKTQDITLLPIGGLARLERMPDDPRQEIWVALAGPAVNVVIALLLYAGLRMTSQWTPLEELDFEGGNLLQRLMVVNVVLVVFNMIPAFPMDGGRVLRGVLAMGMSYARATRIAANLGQFLALLLGLTSLFYSHNPFLLFIALFVWLGASQEASMAQVKSVLGEVPVERAMITEFRAVSPEDPLSRVIDLILSGTQQDFPVLDGGEIVGVLTRGDLLVGLGRQGRSALVAEVMRRDFKVAEASEPLDQAFTRLQASECKTMPVVRFGELVGLVTLENVGEFVMIQSALDDRMSKSKRGAKA